MLTEPRADEITRLQRGMNDLASVLALPAMWTGHEPARVATILTEVLVQILRLDFAYLYVRDGGDGSPGEWIRFGDGSDHGLQPHDAGRALRPFLTDTPEPAAVRIANPVTEGTVSLAVFHLGLVDEVGVLAAGTPRSEFPSVIERLVLQVAANQAAIALQEARQVRHRARVTEELQRRVVETEDRLQRMADSIPEVIWITALEPEERLLYASPSFERVWGLPLADLYDNPRLWTQTIHVDDRARVADTFSRWIAGDDVSYHDVEFRIVRPDGTVRWIHERGVLTANEHGQPVRVSGISTDITDRKLADDELKQAFGEIQRLKDQLQQENIALRHEVEQASMFEEIVGVSAPLRSLLSQLTKVAPTDSTVLISGETGTGKELVARAIHKRSARAGRAFVSVNCAAIPASLIASELFGHEKGAFTGAVQRRPGHFELAEGGTLFLDEVGELPAETQIALLRVLQEHEFERVGGTRPIRVDVRVIAATNRNLHSAVVDQVFRADLFYRLNVFPLDVPPLRERRTDIPMLVEYFSHRYAKRAGKRIQGISKHALRLLQSYEWPGNVRELQNVIERAVIISESETLSIDERWLSVNPAKARPSAPAPNNALAARERDAIEAALADSLGRVAGPFGAAARLGLPASTLESKIRAFKIDKRRFRSP